MQEGGAQPDTTMGGGDEPAWLGPAAAALVAPADRGLVAPAERGLAAALGRAAGDRGTACGLVAPAERGLDGDSVRSRIMSNQAASPRPAPTEHTVDSPSSTESSSRRNLPTARRCAAVRGRSGANGTTRAGRVGGVAGSGSGKRLARLALFFSTARMRR